LIPGYVLPLDPDCPDVLIYFDSLDQLGSSIADEIADEWSKLHRNACRRCREYGVANIEPADRNY
jgi:hypothetical protein